MCGTSTTVPTGARSCQRRSSFDPPRLVESRLPLALRPGASWASSRRIASHLSPKAGILDAHVQHHAGKECLFWQPRK